MITFSSWLLLSPLVVWTIFSASHFLIDASMKYFYMMIVFNLVGVSNISDIQFEFGFMF